VQTFVWCDKSYVDRVELVVASHHKVPSKSWTRRQTAYIVFSRWTFTFIICRRWLIHALCMPTIHFTSTVCLRLCCVSVVLLTHVTSRLSQARHWSRVVQVVLKAIRYITYDKYYKGCSKKNIGSHLTWFAAKCVGTSWKWKQDHAQSATTSQIRENGLNVLKVFSEWN